MRNSMCTIYKMAYLLAVCTVEEQRAVIRFLLSKGINPCEIQLLQQYGDAYIWGAVLLPHNNMRPYKAAATLDTSRKWRFQILEHPPYIPDLVPSDYHVFGPVKDAVSGWRFGSDDKEVGATVWEVKRKGPWLCRKMTYRLYLNWIKYLKIFN